MNAPQNVHAAISWLRTPQAIRERCNAILALAERNRLDHFGLRQDRLDAAARYVVETIRANYPSLNIPLHSRWRHFAVGGADRWALLRKTLGDISAEEIARIRFDLAATSVLLDAGAGEAWRYKEPGSGDYFKRSEGLAVASFHLFAQGTFSSVPNAPLRADAQALLGLDRDALSAGLQIDANNPLTGLKGRIELLNKLGAAMRAHPDLFGAEPRVGHLFDYLAARSENSILPASTILDAVLRGLGPIWPGRIRLGDVSLGDVWRHPALCNDAPSDGLIPFHKLSQWLVYSLIEPLEEAGLRIAATEALTGLAEYRNGGLFIDLGVLKPKHPAVLNQAHPVDAPLIVEWRALTVALLDRLAERVRAQLGMTAAELPLLKILEGGTWSAGRRSAHEQRRDGAPPIRVISDGTVF